MTTIFPHLAGSFLPAPAPKKRRLRLGRDWRRVLRHAWSIRFILIAGLCAGAEAALTVVAPLLPIAPWLLALVTLAVVAAALVSRLMAQETLGDGD